MSNTPEALSTLAIYMEDRAKELHECLQEFIVKEAITVAGGVVVVGWSFAANWILALLSYGSTLPTDATDISPYLTRLVLLGEVYAIPIIACKMLTVGPRLRSSVPYTRI